MLEQEMASIIMFALNSAGNPAPYYYDVPENFKCPAMYFPQPEIATSGDTFLTYDMRFAWYINVFCATREKASAMAQQVLTAIKQSRNLIPLITEDGEKIEGSWLRLDDPSFQIVDGDVAQLTLTWHSRRPYASTLIDYDKVMKFTASMDLR